MPDLISRMRALADAWDQHYRGGRERDAKEECAVQVRAVLDAHEEAHPTIYDGFGNVWALCSHPDGCGLQVVRPGKVKCVNPTCAN